MIEAPLANMSLIQLASPNDQVPSGFPLVAGVKEDFAPALTGLPGQFPVYLRLPYRRDSYFCFRQQSKQDLFLSILSDCIRHQNHGPLTYWLPDSVRDSVLD